MSAAVATAPAVLQDVVGLPPADLALPVLESVANRAVYRSRQQEETEEAHWYSAEQQDELVETQQVHLKSIHSKQSSVIVFTNKSPYRVRALWLDFEGDEVVYSVLEPNTTKRYHTYITHPWIVREVKSGTRMMLSGRPAVVGMSTEQVVEVQAPPELIWTLDTHGCFPAPFKQSVKALLLSHKKLELCASSSSQTTPSPRDGINSPTNKKLAWCGTAGAAGPEAPPSPLTATSVVMCSKPGTAAVTAEDLSDVPCSPKAHKMPSYLPPMSPCSRPPAGTSAAVALPGTPRLTPATDLTASTTSICISTEAANFTATVTVTSPKRSLTKSTLNIAVNTALSSSTATVAFDTVVGGLMVPGAAGMLEEPCTDAAFMPVDSSSKAGGRKGSKTPRHLFNNLVSNFKNLMKPKVASSSDLTSTHITLEVTHTSEPAGACGMGSPAADDDMALPRGTHLGNLPSHLFARIAELAAHSSTVYQTTSMPAKGKPDILPVLMACPPRTKEEEEAQAQQEEDDADGEVPPLI